MIKFNPLTPSLFTFRVVGVAEVMTPDARRAHVVTLVADEDRNVGFQFEVDKGELWRFKVNEVVPFVCYCASAEQHHEVPPDVDSPAGDAVETSTAPTTNEFANEA